MSSSEGICEKFIVLQVIQVMLHFYSNIDLHSYALIFEKFVIYNSNCRIYIIQSPLQKNRQVVHQMSMDWV